MRQIKFRAWDKNKKEWIGDTGTTFTSAEITEGQVALSLSGHLRVFQATHWPPLKGETECMLGVGNTEYESVHPCRTDPSYERQYELSQFTGLLDKNGKEIYEGDIVLLPADDVCACMRCIRILGGERWMSEVIYQGAWFIINNHGADNAVEVVGNIYENPELLTEQ